MGLGGLGKAKKKGVKDGLLIDRSIEKAVLLVWIDLMKGQWMARGEQQEGRKGGKEEEGARGKKGKKGKARWC